MFELLLDPEAMHACIPGREKLVRVDAPASLVSCSALARWGHVLD